MLFTPTPLQGAYLVDLKEITDDRGFFARAFCAEEFERQGLKPVIAQANMSFNHRKGTLRGLHYQLPPAAETKLLRCISGAIWDVIVDMRPTSETYLQHFSVELSAANRKALYVPEMFAHGYLTLSAGAEVFYSVGELYTPGAERGLRYDDPALGITWPADIEVISEKDANWPFLNSEA